MKRIVSLLSLVLISTGAMAQILDTDHYRIVINCLSQDHEAGCQRASYEGTNKQTGETIRLIGRQIMEMCSDKVKPCHSLGYEFSHGRFSYFISENGQLKVTDGAKVLVEEDGDWTNQ